MNRLREVELIVIYRLLVCFVGSELESHYKTDSGISIVLTNNKLHVLFNIHAISLRRYTRVFAN